MRIAAGLIFMLGLLAPQAHAEGQFSASAALDSDDRLRGISVSHARPDARFDLGYDHDSGLYAGASLAAAASRNGTAPLLHYTAYAGWVSPVSAGVSWEAGISHSHVGDRERYDYDELYTGLIAKAVSVRLSYSPRYYGHDVQTLYADLSGSHQLSPRWRVFAHAGWLTGLSGAWGLHARYDVSGGVATTVEACELRLSLTHAPPLYAWGRDDGGTGLVVSAVRAF